MHVYMPVPAFMCRCIVLLHGLEPYGVRLHTPAHLPVAVLYIYFSVIWFALQTKKNKNLKNFPGHLFDMLSLFNVANVLLLKCFIHFSASIVTLFKIIIPIQWIDFVTWFFATFGFQTEWKSQLFMQFEWMTFPYLFALWDIPNVLLISALFLFFSSSNEM